MSEQESPQTTLDAQAAKSSPAKPESNPSPAEAASTLDPTKNEEAAAEATAALSSTKTPATETASSNPRPATEEEDQLDVTVRISKDSQVRKLISFVMNRLDRGGTVTLQALNQCVHKALTVALISRDRLGNIYQVNSLLVVQEGISSAAAQAAQASSLAGDAGGVDDSKTGADEQTARVRTTSGIQIILSKTQLDDNEVGYEKPQPKGFVSQVRQKRYQDRQHQRKLDQRASEKKAQADKVAAAAAQERSNAGGKRRAASRRREDQAAAAAQAKDASTKATQGSNRRQKSRGRSDKQQQPEKHQQQQVRDYSPQEDTPNQATAGKSRRRRQQNKNRNRSKTEERTRSPQEQEVDLVSQGRQRRNRSRRGSELQHQQQQTRDLPPPRPDNTPSNRNRRQQSPPRDYDYMGREITRNSTTPRGGNRRMMNQQNVSSSMNQSTGGGQYAHQQQPYNGGNSARQSSGYQRRGAPYEVGQSHHYMPGHYHGEESERYFAHHYQPQMHQYSGAPQGRRGGFRGNRGGGGAGEHQARPGYFPASSRPQRPDQLVDDHHLGGYGAGAGSQQQRRHQRQHFNAINAGGYAHHDL